MGKIKLELKEIIEILDNEADYYENKRKNLTNMNDILKENYYNKFYNYAECCRDLKSTFLLKIMKLCKNNSQIMK